MAPPWKGRRYAGFMVSKSQRQVSREHTGRLARQLSPSELSIAVRVASQGPRKKDLRMWREYAEATLFHAASLQPNHMAFIANGFARAEVPDREVFDRMSDQAFRRVDHFEPRDLALFLNAYARLQFRDLALFKAFSKVIRRSSSVGFGEQQLSLLCNAYARLEIADTELFQKLSRWTARRAVELTPQGVATVANAYAKVLISDEALFAALREGIGRNGPDFKAQHVANLLNAFARLELREERLTLGKLANLIPDHSRDFQPLELSQALHALVKLDLASEHRKSMICLAEAVQEKADEFHSRQLALTLHSFSMLNTSYGRLLQNMVPQVLSTLSMADHQSAAMVFCAYARAGQVNAEVLQALTEKLNRGVADAGEQMQVQLFYACGRFGLHKEPLTLTLAELLRQNVLTLSGQHMANCLLTVSRLSLCNEPLANLLTALQARLLRRNDSLEFEAQHLANSLYALAGIYGDGAPTSPALSTPLPNAVVPRLVEEVVQSGSAWQQNPQLLASAAVAAARMRQGSPEFFSLVSQTVRGEVTRRGSPKLSKQNQAELLWSFAVSGFFDLDFFSWVLSQLDAGSLASVPSDALLSTLRSLDYVSFSGQFEEDLGEQTAPEDWQGGGANFQSLLFLQCPASFRKQALNFYERVGLTLLLHSPKLPAKLLQDAAPAFGRAGLLNTAVPFDLLKPSTADFFGEAAAVAPTEPPWMAPQDALEETAPVPVPGNADLSPVESTASSMSLMEFFLEELSSNESFGGSSSSRSSAWSGPRPAYLLAKYAKLLPQDPQGASTVKSPSIPSGVLDPLLRKMGAVLRDSAKDLSFAELAETLATLADAGIRPADVWEALTQAAEACDFPKASEPGAPETVASFLHGFSGATRNRPRSVLHRLSGFLRELEEVPTKQKLGLRSTARLLATLEGETLQQTATAVGALLRTAMAEAEANPEQRGSFEDLTELLYALKHLSNELLRQPGSSDALSETLSSCSALLQGWLCDTSGSPSQVLELLHALAASPSESRSPELLASLAQQLLSQSQVLGGAGLAFALQAFGRLRVLDRQGADQSDKEAKLPRLVASLLRSLLVLERRLSLSDAAKGAHFCAQAFDSPLLTEAERAEAKDGLARLLERLCWEQKRWSLEDRKLLTEVATLLRSEYPELLYHSGWVARSVISTLEILR